MPTQFPTADQPRRYLRALYWTALLCSYAALMACSSQPKSNIKGAGGDEIAMLALSLVGTPYRYGGNSPEGGFDCSGLVQYVYRHSNQIRLPRTANEQGQQGTVVSVEELAVGDLLFYNTDGAPYSHVGIYVGQGRFVHAPNSGGVVRLEDMQKKYWLTRFTQAKRLTPPSMASNP